MLSVGLNWIYIILTTFCAGSGIGYLVEKKLRYRIRGLDSILMAGLVAVTVYAEVFSLFYKVGAVANGILAAVCLGVFLLLRRQISRRMGDWWRETPAVKKVLLPVLFLLWAYFSSRGYMAYDSDLYHGQSIRWIEEYGVVPGLGNLHERFAYNSAAFAANALYSMKWLLGRSLHTASGFFALLLSSTALELGRTWKEKKLRLADFAMIGAVYYLATIWDEVTAPSSDYLIMCTLFFIVIKWLLCLERDSGPRREGVVPYALLCVAGVYALTLKLTAGLILLLVLKPAVSLLREERWGEILLYLGLGLLVCLPWMVRTVVISGWLLYPFPALDLFSVDWKMPAGPIALDAAQIKTWGRALNNAALVDMPMREWFPGWFAALSGMEKLLILGDLACIPLFMGYALLSLLKKKKENLDILLVLATVIGSYGFWQYSAPILRYGYAYVLLVDLLLAGIILQNLRRQQVLYAFVCLYGCYKLVMMGDYIRGNYLIDAYVWQQDYGSYELTAYELGGITFYHPAMGDRTGYADFPAAPTRPRIELRGDGLEDGFRPAGQ
ncbi:MAG: hypothetical protein HFH81_05215 [Lachnospiraceae bacterium]|jgi:hypothetical protein|nr:hypothetical protein [Lachnospiraceae bacterium]